jgi:hypothetical protein
MLMIFSRPDIFGQKSWGSFGPYFRNPQRPLILPAQPWVEGCYRRIIWKTGLERAEKVYHLLILNEKESKKNGFILNHIIIVRNSLSCVFNTVCILNKDYANEF